MTGDPPSAGFATDEAKAVTVRALGVEALAPVLALFDEARAWQAAHGGGRWATIDAAAIAADLAAGHVFAMDDAAGEVLIFTIIDADPGIWGRREAGDALYLHRVVVRPDRRGGRHFATLIDWTVGEARRRGRAKLRLDTWREARDLQAYYATCGFTKVVDQVTPDDPSLPEQNRGLAVTLMERRIQA